MRATAFVRQGQCHTLSRATDYVNATNTAALLSSLFQITNTNQKMKTWIGADHADGRSMTAFRVNRPDRRTLPITSPF